MAFSAKIKVSLKLGTELYNANLHLPDSAPTPEQPFLFHVTSKPFSEEDTSDTSTEKDKSNEKGKSNESTLLTVAIGGDKDHVYVAVAPPKPLLKSAGVGELVQELQVIVGEGQFNEFTNRFDVLANAAEEAAPIRSSGKIGNKSNGAAEASSNGTDANAKNGTDANSN